MPAGSMQARSNGASPVQGAFAHGRERRIYAVLGVLLVLLCAISLPIAASNYLIYSPAEVASAFATLVQLAADALGGKFYTGNQVIEMCPCFYQVMSRGGATLIAVLCGAMAALAGSLYQMVFRNPIAAPTMLGVGNGVTAGIVVLVMVFGASAPYMYAAHYLLSYGGAIVVLAIVIGISLALGKGDIVPVDMILVGTVFSALLGQVVVYITYCVFDTDTWAIYNAINEVLDISTDAYAFVLVGVVFVVGVIPVFLLRFKLNIVAFDPQEMRLAGMSPTVLRTLALVCGTIMIIAAQVHLGTVSIMALVVPFVSRKLFSAEFGKQFWGDLLLGAVVVLLCVDVTALAEIGLVAAGINLEFPLGLVANIVATPLFAWAILSAQRGWE